MYRARGSVRVSPGMLDTKVIVAPNSPRLLAKARIMPVAMPGAIMGKVIVVKTLVGPALRVRAANSSLWSTFSSDSRIDRTIKGKPITADATAAPSHLKDRVKPKESYSQLPSTPPFPRTIKRRYPITTGGTTKGRWIIPSR